MFVRKKTNKSGKVSVQIIDKSTGNYKVINTVGCSSDSTEVDKLIKAGKKWITDKIEQLEIDFFGKEQIIESSLNAIEQINVIGSEMLLGKIYDDIGFNILQEPLLKGLGNVPFMFPSEQA